MEAIFPVSDLQKAQSKIKNAAKKDVVRITENGRAAYIFCSEEVFERKLEEQKEQTLYEIRMATAIKNGRQDLNSGKHYDEQSAWKEIEKRAQSK